MQRHIHRDKNSVLIVSAYWLLRTSKYDRTANESAAVYNEWLKNTLSINAPYVVYRDSQQKPNSESFRPHILWTLWLDMPFTKLRTARMNMSEVSKVWMVKIDLLYHTYTMFPSVTWFVWADAALNEYRKVPPPSTPWPRKDLSAVYPTNKFVYVQTRTPDRLCLPQNEGIMGGTVFLVHNRVIREVHSLFYETFRECWQRADENHRSCCTDDQIIFYLMRIKKPHLFSRSKGKGDWAAIIKDNYWNNYLALQ